jgi:L-ascorbate metabolism protein UlaG (beta-lactamase superfamily)
MEPSLQTQKVLEFAKTIHWLGQATVKIIYKGQTIYIDPYQLKSIDKADLILITHDHMDHLSPADISKIAGKTTKFIVAGACADTLLKHNYQNVQVMKPGETITYNGLTIKAVPAYNIKKPMHKKSSDYLGFVIDFDGISLYHTGDTERIPEMKQIRCDIIMLPLGQTYTMNNVEEAVDAVLDTKASVAIPIHYGMYEGTKEDATRFADLLTKKGVTVLWGK